MKIEELKQDLETLSKKIAEFEKQEQDTGVIPKLGDTYYFINNYGMICTDTWNAYSIDLRRQSIGNTFQTELEAQRALCQLKLNQKLIEMGGRKKFKPGVDNYSIFYDTAKPDYWNSIQSINQVYFDANSQCQQAIDTYKSEILFVMGVTDSI